VLVFAPCWITPSLHTRVPLIPTCGEPEQAGREPTDRASRGAWQTFGLQGAAGDGGPAENGLVLHERGSSAKLRLTLACLATSHRYSRSSAKLSLQMQQYSCSEPQHSLRLQQFGVTGVMGSLSALRSNKSTR